MPSVIDEEEWESRNFGSNVSAAEDKNDDAGAERKDEEEEDTSEDSVSDLETDTDDDDDEDDGPSRPLTADEARLLRDEWRKKYAPNGAEDDSEDDSDYENARR